jgi:hypothetical protein
MPGPRPIPVFHPRVWDPPGGSEADPTSRFYIYPQLLRHAMAVRRCFDAKPWMHNLSRSQYLFEYDLLDAALQHPLRTRQRREASVFLLPLLGTVSRQAGDCQELILLGQSTQHPGTAEQLKPNHAHRMREVFNVVRSEVDFSAGSHLVPCTCTMQRAAYGPALFDLLSNQSDRIVAFTHARKAPPLNVARMHVISPYHSAPAFAAVRDHNCDAVRWSPQTAVAIFAGSPDTTRLPATCASLPAMPLILHRQLNKP